MTIFNILGIDPMYFVLGLLGVYFGTIFYARKFSEKALDLITNEQKGMMIDGFKQLRKRGMYIMFAIIFSYVLVMFVGTKNEWLSSQNADMSIWVYFAAIFGYLIYQQVASLAIYKKMDFPQEFISLITKASVIKVISLVFVCVGMFFYLKDSGVI